MLQRVLRRSGGFPIVEAGSRYKAQVITAGLAPQAGLEPATPGLEGRCSIQLSYWSLYRPLLRQVGARGFEPPTPCAQGRCATRLRYAPIEAGHSCAIADGRARSTCLTCRPPACRRASSAGCIFRKASPRWDTAGLLLRRQLRHRLAQRRDEEDRVVPEAVVPRWTREDAALAAPHLDVRACRPAAPGTARTERGRAPLLRHSRRALRAASRSGPGHPRARSARSEPRAGRPVRPRTAPSRPPGSAAPWPAA